IPAGSIAAVAALIVWFFSQDRTSLIEARTAATITMLFVGLGILERLTGTLPTWRWALIGAMSALVAAALTVPFARTFFELQTPPADIWRVIVVVVVLAIGALRLVPVTADSPD
ncbi:MAG: hypothetical protein KDB26_16030, partial [Microthrixaceae bacterium]|nr:hypothetical protein [Microthrixaceae bacterium]